MQKYLSLSNKLIKIIILVIFLSGCSKSEIWNIPETVFKNRISNGDYYFLQHLDYQKLKLKEVFKLDKNAPLYFYYIFKRLHLENLAWNMVELELKKGKGIYQTKAAILAVNEKLKKDKYQEALSIVEKVLDNPMPDSLRERLIRAKVESLYWLNRDSEVLKLLSSEKQYLDITRDAELRLFQAVSTYRMERKDNALKLDNWVKYFRELYFEYSASFVHSRAYAFLRKNDLLENYFDLTDRSIFKVKDLIGRGLKKEAIRLIRETLLQYPVEISERSPLFVKECGLAFLSMGDYLAGAEILERASSKMEGKAFLNALEMAGRNFRKGRNYLKAEYLFNKVLGITHDAFQYDRVLWFNLEIKLHSDYRAFLNEVLKSYQSWNDVDYFKDLLNEFLSMAVGKKDWKGIYRLYLLTRNKGPSDIVIRSIYIIQRSLELGFLRISLSEQSVFNESIVSVLKEQEKNYPESLYYKLLLMVRNEDLLGASLDDYSRIIFGKTNRISNDKSELYMFIKGFFDFGLFEEGYRTIRENRKALSSAALRKAADILQKQGMFRESLNIVRILLEQSEGIPDREIAMLYYPKAFIEAVEKNSQRYNLPSFMLYALIREESHFDSKIKSSAGAVGLTQLLPVTGRDVARKLRIGFNESELYDPVINIKLGTKHLADLYRRLESFPKALIAYNAGLKRLRGWEKKFDGFPDDLFAEAIPYRETRTYVKKVFVASIYYSSLYYGKSIRDMVLFFFKQ